MKRIITENGPDGRSRLRTVADVAPMGAIWETSPRNWLGDEPDGSALSLDFPVGHVVARHILIPPDSEMAPLLAAGIPGLDENGFHKTPTIDYLILIDGELVLELDEGSEALKPGDIVVQRNTNHAWRNPGTTPATCIAIVSRPEA
ncbi:cupin domain-containing protein [Flavisphingomonas formosensis]|uniref:cupin domain-containing protein n=1 Tax=Flavisphingomonas formosensis TaxID=861534 RepID=UPI001E605AD6|nr:cupin domain-containing protein [Sphingomonas formosensis]